MRAPCAYLSLRKLLKSFSRASQRESNSKLSRASALRAARQTVTGPPRSKHGVPLPTESHLQNRQRAVERPAQQSGWLELGRASSMTARKRRSMIPKKPTKKTRLSNDV